MNANSILFPLLFVCSVIKYSNVNTHIKPENNIAHNNDVLLRWCFIL